MPKIIDQTALPCSPDAAFREVAAVEFMRKLDPNQEKR